MKYYIYKIFIKDKPEIFYIGSTIRFAGRKSHHKKNTTNKVGKKYWTRLYVYIRDNGGWDNCIIEIIETGNYETRRDLVIKEQEYIDNLKPELNSIKACIKEKKKIELISIDNINNIDELYI
jgi:hypothetical protein